MFRQYTDVRMRMVLATAVGEAAVATQLRRLKLYSARAAAGERVLSALYHATGMNHLKICFPLFAIMAVSEGSGGFPTHICPNYDFP